MRRDMIRSLRPGRDERLRFEAGAADEESVTPSGSAGRGREAVSRRSERGQALVEFAIAAPVFVLLVAGIIQFGVAINYWFELNRLANQGARWAVVNSYPGCPRTGPNQPCPQTLQQYLSCEPVPDPLEPSVTVSFPAGTQRVGDPVKVSASSAWEMVPIIGVGTLTLNASATMRLEQEPGRYGAGSGTCP